MPCYIHAHIKQFIKDHTSGLCKAGGLDNADTNWCSVKYNNQDDKYVFTHKNWNGPITLDLSTLNACYNPDSQYGNLLLLYVIGKLNELLGKGGSIYKEDIELINESIKQKINVINILTPSSN
jgi:hypothetical protein